MGKYRQLRRNRGKAIPITCPELSRKLRLPDCKTIGLYPHKIFLLRISVRVLSRPQDHSAVGRVKSMKTPTTPSGIEIATCRLVKHGLNQLGHRFRPVRSYTERKFKEGKRKKTWKQKLGKHQLPTQHSRHDCPCRWLAN